MQRVSWRVMSNLSDSLSSSQDDNKSKEKKKQRKISLDTWDNVVRQSVGWLPVGTKRKCCRGFTTLTASVYHPLLRKQIPLAIMETPREDTANVELFWIRFNKALGKVVNDPLIKFNPIGWCSDRAGANLAGIMRVYGNASLIQSCVNCVHNCDDHSLLDFKSAVQYMKRFIYHFTSILHGLIRTHK